MIKHLTPKTEEEIQVSLKNLSLREALEIGIEQNILWLVKDILAKGININEKWDRQTSDINGKWYYQTSALRIAVLNRNMEMVKLLLENGADPNMDYSPTFFLTYI